MLLAGKKALVTGARRNIGRGIALALAHSGCDVAINDVEDDCEVDRTLRMLRDLGREAAFFQADVSNAAQVGRMFDDFLQRFGQIDILVNNAYYATHAPFLELTEENWDRTLGVCLKGCFLCSQRAVQNMVENGNGGSIVHISSIHSHRVWPADTTYGVAKAGIDRLTTSMAVDLGQYGIRTNSILPGYVQTEYPFGEQPPAVGDLPDRLRSFIPAARCATPEDIGQAVAFLCSTHAGNINGVSLPVDGGFLVAGTP